jgi:tRNA nucleotidyltransferase (CCA-adding enzyme)
VAGRLLDPHAGARDLERGKLRAVGAPLERFREDALRPLRVARFRATLELEPDDELWDAVLAAAREGSGVRFAAVAPERVRAELEALMAAARPSRGLELLSAARLLDLWMPEVARGRGVTQNRFHAYDVLEHSFRTCDAAPAAKPLVRWAALLHDIGKPVVRAGPEGAATFHGHAEAGAGLADALLQRLRFPNEDRAWIVHLVREHMFDVRADWTDAAIRRWLRRVGVDAVADLFDLRIADALASGVRDGFPAGLEPLRRRIEALLAAEQALAVDDLAVDGRDVMRELGIAPGPEVGRTLAFLLDAVIEEPARNTRETLLAMLHARRGHDA